MNIESLFDLLHKVKMDRPQQQEIEILTDRETAKGYKQLLAVALTNWSRKRKLKYRRRIVRNMSDPIDKIFADVAAMTPPLAVDEDPYQTEEYQKFVASMVEHCHCCESNRPCDGVLAGGVCDGVKEPCDHDWKEIDASFDHEFGTEQVFYRECQKCNETTSAKPYSYGDGE